MSDPSLRILTARDVDKVINTLDQSLAISSQRAVFAAYSTQPDAEEANGIKKLQLPLRHALTSPDSTMLFMPARVTGATTCKIVSVPKVSTDGLPGSTVVMDEHTGRVRAVINSRRITALRNAAGSVLSYQALHPSGTPTSLLLFGSGTQADGHVRAFCKTYPSISTVTIVARKSTDRSTALIDSLAESFPSVAVSLGIASFADGTSSPDFDLSSAVSAADIICTMTSSTQPLFASADVKPGTHLCLIGSFKHHMREVEDALIRRAGVVLVDSREACAAEAGELVGFPEGDMVEIGEVVDEGSGGRERVVGGGDVSVFKSVGLGVQDVAMSAVVLAEAERMGLGVVVGDYDI